LTHAGEAAKEAVHMKRSFDEQYESYRSRIEPFLPTALERVVPAGGLRDAMAYSLMAGGKRIRPVMLQATVELCLAPSAPGARAVRAAATSVLDPLPAAAALEFVHTYSLIHDDLPALDNDDLRRGRATLHRAHGEDLAILAGDALCSAAFELIATAYGDIARIAASLELEMARGTSAMILGQVWDTRPDTRPQSGKAMLFDVWDHKTGALITAALRMGGLLGGATKKQLAALSSAGHALGRLFQITDDMLDVTATAQELGKTPGKDEVQSRLTAISVYGLSKARSQAEEITVQAHAAFEPFGEAGWFMNRLVDMVADRKK
jgi:geranylgeranyl diphosphate synthase, type II